jgi:hypothetical protein
MEVNLSDLVCGFPFSPSDMVLRREWVFRVDLFDEKLVFFGEDLDFQCRLALLGCKFAGINRSLNYRRYHSNRQNLHLYDRLKGCQAALERIFNDPRCPQSVLELRNRAYSNLNLETAFHAFAQGETVLGQYALRKAIRLFPPLMEGQPSKLIEYFIVHGIADDGKNHDEFLREIFSQLPLEAYCLTEQLEWAIARGYLLKGARAVLWRRPSEGHRFFEKARILRAKTDKAFLDKLAAELTIYEDEFGTGSAQRASNEMAYHIKRMSGQVCVRSFLGKYWIIRAFKNYENQRYHQVPRSVLLAIAHNPKYLANRGVFSVFFRSILRSVPSRCEE